MMPSPRSSDRKSSRREAGTHNAIDAYLSSFTPLDAGIIARIADGSSDLITQRFGYSFLGHIAAERNDADVATAWITGASRREDGPQMINAGNLSGATIGHMTGRPDVLETWVRHGGNIDAVDGAGMSILDGNVICATPIMFRLGITITVGPPGHYAWLRYTRAISQIPGHDDYGLIVTQSYMRSLGYDPLPVLPDWERAAFRSDAGSALAQRLLRSTDDPIIMGLFAQIMDVHASV
jgi:hypothetical protein